MEQKKVLLLVAVAIGLFWLMSKSKKEHIGPSADALQRESMAVYSDVYPADMIDESNPAAFGTTPDAQARWHNSSVRKEFHRKPYPRDHGCTDCAKYGVPEPTPGNTHVCPCGLPSKRMIDAYGSNHQLPHMCAPCGPGQTEPSVLGAWWRRNGCADPESVGLDVRPHSSRCGC